MSEFACRAALGLAAIGLALPVGAQQPSAPKAVWAIAWQDNQCTLTTGTDTRGISLRMTPGNANPELHVAGARDLAPGKSAKVTVTALPSGQTIQGSVYYRPYTSRPSVIRVTELGHGFLSAFAQAEELRLVTPKGSAAFSVRGAGKALAALNQCLDVKMEEWGIDPKAYASLRKHPDASIESGVITPQDYPQAALAKNESGTVIVRVNVDTQGRVKECAVVVSSGSKSLDLTTCAIYVRRARFTPAIGSDGQPAPGYHVATVDWWLSP